MTKNKLKKRLAKVVIIFFVASLLQGISLHRPTKLDSASLTSASATLSNSRLSFYGKVSGAHTANDTTIAIDTSGNADNNTSNLFPGDTVSVGVDGGKTVGSIIDSSNFALSAGLTVGADDQAAIYATQSGALTITFTITNDIPANGYVLVTIPDPESGQNDGAPDTAASTTLNGFDLNGMAKTDVVTTGGTGCTWAVDTASETLTAGSGSGHAYKNITSTACTAGEITVTFDGTTKDLVNPAPVTSGHTQGTADVYTIDVDTKDSSNQLIDSVDIKVAPIEAVLVSATVEETLSFTVSASASASTACGITSDVATTVTSIPWGAIATAESFLEAIQLLTVSTNADGGYAVTIEENDQMGRNGGVCTGASAGEANSCIKDTTCGATACTESAGRDWTAATYHGLGFSLANFTGSDAVFTSSTDGGTCTSGTFCTRQIADMEATGPTETKQNIMSATDPRNSSRVNICYRISISNTQPAGYYYNKVKYTATAIF